MRSQQPFPEAEKVSPDPRMKDRTTYWHKEAITKRKEN